jgi:hydrocephalus-inducing protein
MLYLTSNLGGDYTFPLHGICLPPKPQGPFSIKATTNTSISFKNVFSSAFNFSYAIDNPLFHVSKTNEVIKPGQTSKIVVGFDGNDNNSSKADVMAKLVISAPKSAGISNTQWVYYLKGTS